MNGRIVLTPGTVLKLSTKTGYTEYTISRELARGCSCIVYDASYTDNLGNYKLVRVVIQHFLKTIVVQFVFEVIG